MTTPQDPVTTAEAAATVRRLQPLTSDCTNGSCPTVYRSDRATVVVQGYVVPGESTDVEVPDGERLVEIPVEVLLAAADEIRKQA